MMTDEIKNGFVFVNPDDIEDDMGEVSDIERVRRFIHMGTENNTLCTGESELGLHNVQCLKNILERGGGDEVVEEILRVCNNGCAIKQKPIVFALAVCAKKACDLNTRRAAYKAVGEVCKSPTQFFNFVRYAEGLSAPKSGWGRAMKKAVNQWYIMKNPMELAEAVTKYISRNGWSHRDLLRLAHVKAPAQSATEVILKYVIKGIKESEEFAGEHPSEEIHHLLEYLKAVSVVKSPTEITDVDFGAVRTHIEEHKLAWEHIPTPLLKQREVWKGLLQHMPLAVMIKHLGKLSAQPLQLLSKTCEENVIDLVTGRICDEQQLIESKLHPLSILLSMSTYQQGHGVRGRLSWEVNQEVLTALSQAFYICFSNIVPTKKRILIATDISRKFNPALKTMGAPQVEPIRIAASIVMGVARSESDFQIVTLGNNSINPVAITNDMPIQDVQAKLNINQLPYPGTDCARPINWARSNGYDFDVFYVITDANLANWRSEGVTPAAALKSYRQERRISNARLVVMSLTSIGFTLADGNDPLMLDVAGFDPIYPSLIRDFIVGNI